MNKIKKKINKKKYNWFFFILTKFIFLFTLMIIIYGFYLDKKICNRINERVWELPTIVYSQIINLKPEMLIKKDEMIKLLEFNQYRKTLKVNFPGEFSVNSNTIEIIRRSFDFPDIKEEQIHVQLVFDKNCLKYIKNIDTNNQFSFFRLDPRLIAIFSGSKKEQRLFLTRDNFSDSLINALLTIEDRHFYQHDGISFFSIIRAMLANLIAGHAVQGASTLTQQLIKNLFLSSERSYWRKINEAYMALIMETRYSKDHILELYMNEIFFGKNGDHEIHGFPLAGLYYFGRPLGELDLEQQALLVGMVKGASIYNPWKNPKIALKRRNLVLRVLYQQKIINKEIYNILCNRPLGVQSQKNLISTHPEFVQIVYQKLQDKLGNNKKVKDLFGMKIFTTFDFISQNIGDKSIKNEIFILKKAYDLEVLESSMIVVDRYTGETREIVEGSDPKKNRYDRAMHLHQPIGSSVNPIIYPISLSLPDKYQLNIKLPILFWKFDKKIWSLK